MNSGPRAGLMKKMPLDLFYPEAILARNFLYETPAEAESRVSARIRARMALAILVATGEIDHLVAVRTLH